ncbi:MAG: NUDIX domain-containing protein [Planctomycetaceae bacterium]|nr:NUDIX domain-containing protein [Planctomycetaceae bacterium]
MRRGAVAVIVENGKYLVIRRAAGVSAPGKLCFPGGGIEGEESEEAAVVRELREELAAHVRPLRRLWQCVTPWQVHLSWWLAERCRSAPLEPHPPEVAEYLWLTLEELEAHPDLLYSNREFLAAVARGELDVTYVRPVH